MNGEHSMTPSRSALTLFIATDSTRDDILQFLSKTFALRYLPTKAFDR